MTTAPTPTKLTYREFCTMLAAMRVFQRCQEAGGFIPRLPHHPPENEISQMEHFEECDPLSLEEIDALAERINFGELLLMPRIDEE